MKKINPNLKALHDAYVNGRYGCVLEGSSRSGKTFSGIDFLVWLCSTHTDLVINIFRPTYESFKTTLYNDFNRRLPDFGIASPFIARKEVKTFYLFSNKITLIGCEDPAKFQGVMSDIAFFNEAMDMSYDAFAQVTMRCQRFWWMDYNPKFSDHWIYEKVIPRDNVSFFHSTFKDNPHVSRTEYEAIMSYEPTEENKKRGTADEYKWRVFGLGLRTSPEGQIFQNVLFIEKFPENVENIFFGLDFGYTNSPSALVKCGIQGENLFLELLFYAPTPSPNDLVPVLKVCGKNYIWADPSGEAGGRGMITELRKAGFNIFAANTFPGSINYGIAKMKKYRINIVDHPAARREQQNYVYANVRGIPLDKPIDDFNHFWDAARIALLSTVR